MSTVALFVSWADQERLFIASTTSPNATGASFLPRVLAADFQLVHWFSRFHAQGLSLGCRWVSPIDCASALPARATLL